MNGKLSDVVEKYDILTGKGPFNLSLFYTYMLLGVHEL
jgi:hypothetical protein